MYQKLVSVGQKLVTFVFTERKFNELALAQGLPWMPPAVEPLNKDPSATRPRSAWAWGPFHGWEESRSERPSSLGFVTGVKPGPGGAVAGGHLNGTAYQEGDRGWSSIFVLMMGTNVINNKRGEQSRKTERRHGATPRKSCFVQVPCGGSCLRRGTRPP